MKGAYFILSEFWLAILFNIFVGDTQMAVPKSKITPSRRGNRRSHDSLSIDAYIEDKNSGELRRPHHIDISTGMYRGKKILDV